jgi:Flp pilus assembly protein TadD
MENQVTSSLPTTGPQIIDNLVAHIPDMLAIIIGETVGFFVLAFVVAFMLRHRLQKGLENGAQIFTTSVIKQLGECFNIISLGLTDHVAPRLGTDLSDGLRNISIVFSDNFVKYVVPEIVKTREAVEKSLPSSSLHGAITTSTVNQNTSIDGILEDIRNDKTNRDFAKAEQKLLLLYKQNPENFDILNELFLLYTSPELDKNEEMINIALSAELTFKENPIFYRLLGAIYMKLKYSLPTAIAKSSALNAARKCIELEENNPLWTKGLGYVYYWFDDLSNAISYTEKARDMAIEQNNEEVVASCKNNLAYYYAVERKDKNKEKALEYAEAAYKFDSKKVKNLDTMGYVRLRYAEAESPQNAKKYLEEAEKYINMALKEDPHDTDIMTHYTEVLEKLKALKN